MARLTQAEKRLLRFPPTPTTWECLGTFLTIRNEETLKLRCGHLNSGKSDRCAICTKPKPRRPHLIWPRYEAACRKAGIEPGDHWRETEPTTVAAPTRRVRRKA